MNHNSKKENPKPPIQFWKMAKVNSEKNTFDGFEPVVSRHSGDSIWSCGECGVIHIGKSKAEQCCLLKKCDCGQPIDPYYSKCQPCQSKEWNEKKANELVEKLAKAQLVENYQGFIFVDGYGSNDGYFEDEDEFLDACELEDPPLVVPEFAFCCRPNHLKDHKIDADGILESLLDGFHEDAIDQVDFDELQKLLDGWISDQKLISYDVDYSLKVRIGGPNANV